MHDTLLTPLMNAAEQFPGDAMAATRDGDRFVDHPADALWRRVRAVSKGFVALGVRRHDRVALMAHCSLDWMIADHAIIACGAVTVPIYETSSPSQVEWILENSGAVLLVVEDAAAARDARSAVEVTACRDVLNLADGAMEQLVASGEKVTDSQLEERLHQIEASDIATIIYTSGTTGRPKGCALTHHNLRANVRQISKALSGTIDSSDTALVFLPLAHVLTKTTVLFCLEHRIRVAFATSIASLPEEFGLVAPSLISAVPRIFEKVYSKAQNAAESEHKGRIFERSVYIATEFSRQRSRGRVGIRTRIEHRVFDRLVYAKLRHSFGGKLHMAFSGGGPLGERLTSFFDGIGVRIYEGYGLTETSPILTLSSVDHWSPGSVGRAVTDTEIMVASDGEILARGPQVFSGYWRNDQATADVFDSNGWFHTGDIGEFDDSGFLHIVGRSKDLIVTAAGKNVAPAPLEDRLRAHPLISQAMLVGDKRPFIAALVTLDEEALAEWQAGAGEQELRNVIQEAVDQANETVSRAESIRKFVVLPHDFDLESEEITPTMKVRRAIVHRHYADVIESIYT